MALKYKGDRPKGTFYGDDEGVWRYTEDFPWGLWDDGWTWYAAFMGGRSSPVYLDVNGASEQNRGFRKALREIVREYPEVAGYLISFDGPYMPVSSLVGGAAPEPGSRIDLGKQTYYHGTSSDVLDAILSDGLMPRGQTNVEPVFGVEFGARPSRAEAVYLTTQLGLAQSAAHSAARKRKGDPVILEITGLHHDHFQPDEDSRESDAVKSLERKGSVAYVGRIRPRNIRVYAMGDGSRWNKLASPARVASRYAATTPLGVDVITRPKPKRSASDKLTPDSLLKYMRESGDSVTVRDLNYAFPDAGGSNAISAMLKRMVKDGKLVKENKGYALGKTAATRTVVEIAPGQEYDNIIEYLDLDGDAGVDFEVTLVLEGRELAKVLGVQERVLVRRLDQMEKKRDHLISERDLDAIFDMKHKSIHMGAVKAMSDLLDYGSEVTVDLYGPNQDPYLSVKRIKPDAVRVTFEVGSIVTT